jgi:transcriptional regulator with XRE-family HTH domain
MKGAMKSIYSPAYRSLLAWLRACRVNRRLSMREVGKRLGISHSWVGKVETGERRLDVEEYVRLCQALEVNPEQGLAIVTAAMPRDTPAPLPKAAEPRAKYGTR